ncbi:substrate-binding periplasmic protein [Marinobacter fonticola]|uniref:substrate-binding periplasmic protein n=1 Tax=Marinobacter fonticola TaxID=2603215 RepID=UPI0011E6DE38|nr:transporter substrate-binding domain-containing protein [Marinobacter fonticola]
MKPLRTACFVLIGWLLTLPFTSVCANDLPRTLTFAMIPGNPFNRVGQPLIEAIYREVGIEITVMETPPAREIAMLSSGQLDGSMGRVAGLDDQVQEVTRIPVPLTHINLVVFSTLEQLPKLAQPSTATLRVGQLRGIDFGIESSRPVEVVFLDTTEQLMAVLAKRRIDVAIASELGGAFFVQTQNYANVRIVAKPLKVIPVYHYLHKKHVALAPDVQRVMERLQSSGYLEDQHNIFRAQLQLERIMLPASQLVSNDTLRVE